MSLKNLLLVLATIKWRKFSGLWKALMVLLCLGDICCMTTIILLANVNAVMGICLQHAHVISSGYLQG